MSTLHGAAEDYVAIRRAGGFRLEGQDKVLSDLADYLEHHQADWVTTRAVVEWAGCHGMATPNAMSARLSAARRFARYMKSLDDRTEIPPVNLIPRRSARRNSPYLYTPAEIGALMNATGRLAPPMAAKTLRTLIGVMASTGMRTQEATGLGRGDFDFEGAVITVRDTKFHKTRLVPIHATTAVALGAYAEFRDGSCPHAFDQTFFVSPAGRRLRGSLSVTFHQLADAAGVRAKPGRRPPRLSDLRHSFAVATLVDWYAEGADVEARLPILSTYLGHLSPKDTYWYLEDTPDLMAAACRRLEPFLDDGS